MTIHNETATRAAGPPRAVQRMDLAGAHRLEVVSRGSSHELRILDRHGGLGVAITVTDQAITLHVERADLAIRAERELEVSAERLHFHARSGLAITSNGDMTVEATGDISTTGRTQRIEATHGNINLDANDDVRLQGERVRLNC